MDAQFFIIIGAIILVVFMTTVVVALHEEAKRQKRQAEQERRLRAIRLSDVDNMNGIDFEHYICRLLNHKEFSAEVTKASNDFGVDIIATSGGESIAVQVKRYTKNVSRIAVSDAVAGKAHYGCERAMVVTNSYFTKSAIEFANSTSCTLVNRDVLVEWILDFQNSGEPVVDASSADTSEMSNDVIDGSTAGYDGDAVFTSQSESEPRHSENANGGVPRQVVAEIAQRAAAEWPDDYSMQKHEIDEQEQAYKEVTGYTNPRIPQEVLDRIAQRVAAEWPDDYLMQKHEIDEQASAYLEIHGQVVEVK